MFYCVICELISPSSYFNCINNHKICENCATKYNICLDDVNYIQEFIQYKINNKILPSSNDTELFINFVKDIKKNKRECPECQKNNYILNSTLELDNAKNRINELEFRVKMLSILSISLSLFYIYNHK